MKAQELIGHCKDIVIGKTPYPELLRVEVINDCDCRIYYKDSERVVWAFNLDSSETHLAIAARLLGLDRPIPIEEQVFNDNVRLLTDIIEQQANELADLRDRPSLAPVVLEWVPNGYGAFTAIYNGLIRAVITIGGSYNLVFIEVNGARSIYMPKPATEAEARAWCEAEITKIITPST